MSSSASASCVSSNPLDCYPAAAPPPGETSNFVDPRSNAHAIVVLDGLFVSLMLLCVLTRCYVRLRLTKSWGWNDVACLVAACGSLAHTVLYTQSAKIGFGRHMWDIPVSWLIEPHNIRLLSANGITYPATMFFAKLSILLLYLRIFNVDDLVRISIHVCIGLMFCFYSAMVGCAIGGLVQCAGLASATIPFCINLSRKLFMVNSVFNVITDFWILLLPMPLILKMQMRLRQRITALFVFTVGLIACVASLARMTEFAIRYHDSDTLWVQSINAMFTIVEMNTAIMVACVTSFPAFARHAGEHLSSFTSTLRRGLASLTSVGWRSTRPQHTGSGGCEPVSDVSLPHSKRKKASQDNSEPEYMLDKLESVKLSREYHEASVV